MTKVKHSKAAVAFTRKVGDNVKFYRINHNLSSEYTDKYGRISQEKLAELSNLSYSTISRVEAAHVDQAVSIASVFEIAKALNIPPYAFFLEKPIKNPPKDPFENK